MTACLLLFLPPVQQKIKKIVLQEITQKTGSKISIVNFRAYPIGRFKLEEIYAADLKNDTLLYAEKMYAGMDIFKLLRKQIAIHSVEISRFDLRISKDSLNAPFNFQFLIDAFASDKPNRDSSLLHLDIKRIILHDGSLRYDVFSEPFTEPDLIDFNHIDINKLYLNTKLHFDNVDNWSTTVENLTFHEKSGFALKKMKFKANNSDKHLQINQFSFSLPDSETEIQEVNLDYSGLELSKILSGATYSVQLTSGEWYPADFSCFYPKLAEYQDIIICTGDIEGIFPEISLSHFELKYGNQFELAVDAGIADFKAWETSAFSLIVDKLTVDPELFELPINTEHISIKGKITGSLPDLKIDLAAVSKQGDLAMKGTGGYNVSSEKIHFDLDLESLEYDVKNLLSDSVFGKTSFHILTQGTVTGFKNIDVKADAEIHRFDYLGYSYNDITATASYVNDTVSIDLVSADSHLPLKLKADAGLNNKTGSLKLYAELNGVQADVLNFLPQYPGVKLSGIVNADIKGFDPELMTASISIDNFNWTTTSENFNASPLTISYTAETDGQKQINMQSPILNVRGKGNLTYNGIIQSFKQSFPVFFPSDNFKNINTISDTENFDFLIDLRQANTVARLLRVEANIPDSTIFIGKYEREGEKMNLDITAYCAFIQSDTAQIHLNLSNLKNNLVARLDLKNKSNLYELDGYIGASIDFFENLNGTRPDINIILTPGMLTLNNTTFMINPAEIFVKDKQYEINNFALRHSTSEYIRVNGIISDNDSDSLQINVNRFEIGTFLSVIRNNIALSGAASGDMTLSQLTKNPLVLSRNFAIENLLFDGHELGDLQLRSAWSSERQGLALRATWSPPNLKESVLSGFILPKRDSLSLTADIQGVQLKWLAGYLPDIFYGLDGELGAKITTKGKMTDPIFSGKIYLNDVYLGVKALNTKYHITDSINVENEQIIFNNCIIYDETKRNAKINGSIRHKNFLNLTPRLSIDLNQFLVLNNSEQTDSLFYGTIRANGNLTLQTHNKDWLLQGRISNGKASRIMVNLPETTIEAQRYNWLTFVDKQLTDSIADKKEQRTSELQEFSIPLKLQITMAIDPELSMGIVINPETKDAATVTGNGLLDFSYNLANPEPRILGNYVIEDGNSSLSIKNIAKRTFSVQKGGRLNFQGDPKNTTFDLSAIYSLRTYLTSLDPSFATLMTASRVPVNCILTAKGKLDEMQLQYRVELPNQTDEIQRKLDALLYTDEIKIREIAYLLAFGSFMPTNSGSMHSGNSTIWTSLASSSITSQLNNILSGILSDNWSIGTDLHSNDANFSELDMDVNISTRMFNDRLTLNGTVGYHNSMNQINNFTGDFDLEYKLTPKGNILLQFYNVTNNQYYDRSKSPLTQGIGIVYKREAKTFRRLFGSFGTRKNE